MGVASQFISFDLVGSFNTLLEYTAHFHHLGFILSKLGFVSLHLRDILRRSEQAASR
jgi:hypothetical protein